MALFKKSVRRIHLAEEAPRILICAIFRLCSPASRPAAGCRRCTRGGGARGGASEDEKGPVTRLLAHVLFPEVSRREWQGPGGPGGRGQSAEEEEVDR